MSRRCGSDWAKAQSCTSASTHVSCAHFKRQTSLAWGGSLVHPSRSCWRAFPSAQLEQSALICSPSTPNRQRCKLPSVCPHASALPARRTGMHQPQPILSHSIHPAMHACIRTNAQTTFSFNQGKTTLNYERFVQTLLGTCRRKHDVPPRRQRRPVTTSAIALQNKPGASAFVVAGTVET